MLLTKLKVATAMILLMVVAMTGIGWLNQPTRADPPVARVLQREERPAGGRTGADSRGTPATEVRGILKSVDAGKQTLTVTVQPNRRDGANDWRTTLAGKAIRWSIDGPPDGLPGQLIGGVESTDNVLEGG